MSDLTHPTSDNDFDAPPPPNGGTGSGGSAAGILPKRILVPVVALLIAFFILVLFPWDSIGRRIAWEISRVSGARVEVNDLSPALTARGPVLRATNVSIDHPAVDRVRLSELEIAPRLSMSWFSGEPTIRIWTQTGLGNIDGVLRLGDAPAYVGHVSDVDIERLPLRLDASEVSISGRIDAEADVALDPNGTLSGRVDFESPSLSIGSPLLPIAIPFSRAAGIIEILETGATRISEVVLEGRVVEGEIEGEIGLVHRSQSPPLDMTAHIRVIDPMLRQLATGSGLSLDPDGAADVRIAGTVDAPELSLDPTRRTASGARAAAARRNASR